MNRKVNNTKKKKYIKEREIYYLCFKEATQNDLNTTSYIGRKVDKYYCKH